MGVAQRRIVYNRHPERVFRHPGLVQGDDERVSASKYLRFLLGIFRKIFWQHKKPGSSLLAKFLTMSQEERKRLSELTAIICLSLLLLFLPRMETRLFTLSETLLENREFFATAAYFALINFNVVLILILSFLIFRNVTKLLLERKRGVLGSRLKTKLVFSLVFFAIAPTILLFYVSMRFITTSFDSWFSEKVRVTMHQTREAGSLVYKQDQKRLQSLARIALARIKVLGSEEIFETDNSKIDASGLKGFCSEYGISAVKVYESDGLLLFSDGQMTSEKKGSDLFLSQVMPLFFSNHSILDHATVVGEEQEDVVKGVAPIRSRSGERLLGVVVTEVRFETQILKSIEKIISDFANLKPGAQLIQSSYMVLMAVMTLLIVFSAVWMGFYVARAITDPIQSLAEATREIALGNYNISLKVRTDDETGQLVNAFNAMTLDLKEHQNITQMAQNHLQKSNEELDQRRQYMEIVLKHIEAGVISVDRSNRVTSVNSAAEVLLGIQGDQVIGRMLKEGFSPDLFQEFWLPILDSIKATKKFSGSLELSRQGQGGKLMANATRIFDENHVDVGFVVVFDDGTKQMQAQRVIVWREVARRIAHEIKNPITPIKLNAQRLLRRFNGRFEGEEHEVFQNCMETIITQVDSLRDLVNEFSKFSRLPTIQAKKADLGEIIRDGIKLFSLSYPDVIFDDSKVQEVPRFAVDREQLARALVNLFTNSISALVDGRPGRIEVSAIFLIDLNLVRIEVSDNGCGIPANLYDRVLEPYFSTKDGGTGLGLAIVNQIVSDHGGYLRLCPRAPFGTTAIIELPIG